MGDGMSSATWQHDWPIRVYERVQGLGFHSLSEFIDSRPMVTLLELADELGPDIAAIQLESLWFREAEEQSRMAHALGSLFIRRIRDAIPHGWSSGDDFESELAGGFASWGRVADMALSESDQDRVWDKLKNLSPESGWLPVIPHDEMTRLVLRTIETALSKTGTE